MSAARFETGSKIPKHQTPFTQGEISNQLTDEQNFHRLDYRRGRTVALCNCGFLLRGVTERTVRPRHAMHVQVCVDALKARLNGEDYS